MGIFLKKSFSLIEIAIYITVVGILSSVILNSNKLVENAKVNKTIEEIEYYQSAIVEFVRKYGQFPGAMTYKRCKQFPEFAQYCKATTKKGSEVKTNFTTTTTTFQDQYTDTREAQPLHLYDSLLSNVHVFNYGRFLKSSKIIDRVKKGINETLITTDYNWFFNKNNDINYYLPRVKGEKNVFMTFYYQTDNPGFFTANGCEKSFCIFSFPLNMKNEACTCVNSTDYLLIMFNTIYKRDGINAYSPNFMKKIDIKIDNGLPRVGKIVGYSEPIGGCDNGGRTVYQISRGNNITNNSKIEYLNSNKKNNGCQLVYQSSINFSKLLY